MTLAPPPSVLTAYPTFVQECRWELLPSGGGLNGARVWRGDQLGRATFALKSWPNSHPPVRLREVHQRMRAVAAEPFVPQIVSTKHGDSFTTHDHTCWDLTTWLSGTARLLTEVTPAALHSAGATLAILHLRWGSVLKPDRPCTALSRRLDLLSNWEVTRFEFSRFPTEQHFLLDTLTLVRSRLRFIRDRLRQMLAVSRPTCPIHGDFWPENVLFTADEVSAVVDFGNVGYDHPEVDLGRLLADVPTPSERSLDALLRGYEGVAGSGRIHAPLVLTLANSGPVCSLANWHMRLSTGTFDLALLPAALLRIRCLASAVQSDIR